MLAKEKITIPYWYRVDIQDVFKFPGTKKAGMAHIAAVLIDPFYSDMKKLTDNDHGLWHTDPLSQKHMEYAALDGYVSYELWSRLLVIREGLKLGIGLWYDRLCKSCKDGEDYNIKKKQDAS